MLEKAREDVEEFVNDIIEETTISNQITWFVLANNRQKEFVKISKANATTEYFAKTEECIIITINENLFDAMYPKNVDDIDNRRLLISDAFTVVTINDNNKIVLEKPEIVMTSGAYKVYGNSLIDAYMEVYNTKKRMEKEERDRKEAEKQAKAEAKKNKKNKKGSDAGLFDPYAD